MNLKYADLDVTFVGTNAATCEIRGDIMNVANDQNDATQVSNTRIVFSGVTAYDSNGAFNWSTKVSTNCVLRLENGAELSMDNYMHVFGTNTWVEVVEGSQMVWRRLSTDQVGFDCCNFAGGLKVDDATFSTAWLTPQRHVSVPGEPQYVLISGEHPRVQARIRYRSAAAAATVSLDGDSLELRFNEPVWGVTPGQSLVLYQDGLVVGGGLIVG